MKKTNKLILFILFILIGLPQISGQNITQQNDLQVKTSELKPVHREIKVRRQTSYTVSVSTGASQSKNPVKVSYEWSYADEDSWTNIGASFMALENKLSAFEDSKILYNNGVAYLRKAVYVSLPIIGGGILLGAILYLTHDHLYGNNEGITPYKIGIASSVGVVIGGVISMKVFKKKAEKCFLKSVDAYNAQVRLLNGVK